MDRSEQSILREKLLKLSESKELIRSDGKNYTQSYIKKASYETLEKIYKDHQRKQLSETNEMLTDTIVGKFSELMEYLELVDNSTELGIELIESKPFRQDIKLIMEYVTPYIPLIGFFSGGLIVGKHVINKKTNQGKPSNEANSNISENEYKINEQQNNKQQS